MSLSGVLRVRLGGRTVQYRMRRHLGIPEDSARVRGMLESWGSEAPRSTLLDE
jgi:hypothetical protein